jgi:hypothetical protein
MAKIAGSFLDTVRRTHLIAGGVLFLVAALVIAADPAWREMALVVFLAVLVLGLPSSAIAFALMIWLENLGWIQEGSPHTPLANLFYSWWPLYLAGAAQWGIIVPTLFKWMRRRT